MGGRKSKLRVCILTAPVPAQRTLGYLRREPCKEDGRGKRLIITGEGKDLRQRMWLIYGPKLQEIFGRILTQGQCKELGSLLGALSH